MDKVIDNYELYTVNEQGQIYSLRSKKYLKPNITRTGYHTVELFDVKGKSKRLLVHRLVANAFIPNPNNYPQVNHKDENKANNNANNLEWCTAKYNMRYGKGAKERHSKIDYHTDKMNAARRKNAEKTRKPVLQFTKDGQFVARYNSGAEASRSTGVSHSHLLECCNNYRYKTVGNFIWKYDNKKEE